MDVTVIVGLVSLGSLGCALGLWLAFSNRWLAVKVDPKITALQEVLPGTNCGACGFPGCEGAAVAVVKGEASVAVCVAGGQETADDIADVMGVEAGEVRKVVAKIFCQGGEGKGVTKYIYQGVEDCHAALLVAGGPKACLSACVGFGNCTLVCPYGAIVMGQDRLPVVDPELCTGCGLCVAECPRNVIQLVPDDKRVHILCSSHEKGPQVKKVCTVGCIGCNLCFKNCPEKACKMDRFLAVMDYDSCVNHCYCVYKCPQNTIVIESRSGETPLTPREPPKKEKKAAAGTEKT
ncbi:RnfABCDGE type electron transport complex subunit B [bacterium]|nr:RnfABCDGE type electron transport complex subunit B [bacterium]